MAVVVVRNPAFSRVAAVRRLELQRRWWERRWQQIVGEKLLELLTLAIVAPGVCVCVCCALRMCGAVWWVVCLGRYFF